jgi:3',5'-cyclic-AMP phosphodiesterase
MAVNVLQITDLHLFADPETRLKGIPTRESLEDILRQIDDSGMTFDVVVITGDLTHDEKCETYHAVRERLESRFPLCRIIPGNHDDRDLMREVFPGIVPSTGPLTFSLEQENWQLIGLDTHSPGEVPGRIEASQVNWLDEELAGCADRSAAVFLHHPPISVNSSWMDKIALQDPELLLEVFAKHSHLQFVCTGHVHHEFTARIGNADFFTTPSTSAQFLPASETFLLDSIPPGYRTFVLGESGFQTHVHRLPELRFPPVDD